MSRYIFFIYWLLHSIRYEGQGVVGKPTTCQCHEEWVT